MAPATARRMPPVLRARSAAELSELVEVAPDEVAVPVESSAVASVAVAVAVSVEACHLVVAVVRVPYREAFWQ